jgi:hypothetical protein
VTKLLINREIKSDGRYKREFIYMAVGVFRGSSASGLF